MQTFLLPDLGEGLTEAEVVRWLVAVGDVVAVDAPVAEVETAKSIVEVPSPYAGVVAELHGAEGATIDVGKPLISIGALPDPAAKAAEQYREEEQAGSGNVLIGYGTSGLHSTGRNRRPRTTTAVRTHADSKVPLVISPLVRKLAKDTKIDLTTLTGTGAGGVITRRDVESAATPAPQPVVTEKQQDGTDGRTGLPIKLVTPMTGFRKAVATTLSRSRREIPEATTWVDVDATALLDLRESLRTASDPGPGLLALMARFVVAGLLKYPELNGTVDAERDELIQYDGINLGLAAQTDRGLVVPAVLNAHRLTTRGLDAEIRKVTAEAREGRNIGTAGTFTLNNYGSFGVDGSAAIINHPQVAILGVGRIIDRPWVVDGQLAVRKVTQLSFVFDHRVCDGGTAAGFLRFVADAFESPVSALVDL